MFICGSLAPGLDGVGDYVRRLSTALMHNGYSVTAMSWNDPYVNDARKEVQVSEGLGLSVLRLSSRFKAAERDAAARKFVDWINPDVISLQFVPYAFQNKGLPFLLQRGLAPLIKGRIFQVMFHELWLDTPVNLKQKITAVVQRMLIVKLIRILNPQLVNVTLSFNQERLTRLGLNAEILDLFGNIYPAVDGEAGAWATAEPPQSLRLLYFGEVPRGAFRTVFLRDFVSFCKCSRHPVKLLLACGNSPAKALFCTELNLALKGCDYELEDCGFLSVEALSALMRDCQAGISKSKPHLLAKSGAAVAMLEHGLPVWLPRWNGAEALYIHFRKELVFAELQTACSASKLSYHSLLPEVAGKFIHQLRVSGEESVQ
ncbi:MAG: glycosyltransferase [Bacteroidota bacterium]